MKHCHACDLRRKSAGGKSGIDRQTDKLADDIYISYWHTGTRRTALGHVLREDGEGPAAPRSATESTEQWV